MATNHVQRLVDLAWEGTFGDMEKIRQRLLHNLERRRSLGTIALRTLPSECRSPLEYASKWAASNDVGHVVEVEDQRHAYTASTRRAARRVMADLIIEALDLED
jgi:hypothetical protein